jgi:hypothetical protein
MEGVRCRSGWVSLPVLGVALLLTRVDCGDAIRAVASDLRLLERLVVLDMAFAFTVYPGSGRTDV